ncbi:MAG TPA: ABC transporter transmembrane domain-containing protein [Anaeromyxobacteraceae bacterium]|nr:ABC transporter transmembrane domain-containing protein [Anaeromyxobacteraceae bacterium]
MRTYLRLFRFALPYKWKLIGALACMVILAGATAAYVNLLGPALDFLFTGRMSSAAHLGKLLPGRIDLAGFLSRVDRRQMLAILPLVIVLMALVKGFAFFGQFFLMQVVSQRLIADLRRALFNRLVTLPPAFYAKRHSGDLVSRFSQDVSMVQNAITEAIATYLRDGLTVIVMLTNCFILDWKLSLMVFGAMPGILVPVMRISKRIRRSTGDSVATLGYIVEIVIEALAGIRVVQAFGMEKWESERFREATRRLLKLERRIAAIRGFSSPLMEVLAALGLGAAIWWVGARILAGQLEAGQFFSFVAAVLLLYTPMKQLGRVGQLAIFGAAAGERVFEILDAKSSVPDNGTEELPPFREAIQYERVTFSYGDSPVLHEIDLTIRKGEVVALVGSSGGGKTTVSNLLPRFWDPVSGRILIDGKDVRDVTLASLRAQLAIVTQETILFNDTVRANIAYGRPDIPQSEVEHAARMAQAHDFILQLPQGYDTPVGERGVRLSGGQRQRLAIARAFLKNAPILILDEATSALDAESEREVQRALESLMELEGGRHRTTLVIAHRLSTIRHADRIVVLSEGRVVESGRHHELVALGGEYARLWRIFEGEERGEAAVPVLAGEGAQGAA